MDLKKTVAFILLTAISIKAYSQSHGSNSNEEDLTANAIKETQDLLINSEKRNEIIKTDSKAKSANESVTNLTGGDDIKTQRIYSISTETLPVLMKEAGNDPEKAAQLLEKAQRDPASFLNSLPKNLQNEIKAISAEIENKKAR